MSSEEALADRFRRALYVYMMEGQDLDHADEDEKVKASLGHINRTLAEFMDGRINLATVKYRMDNEFVETECSFPPREVQDALREAVLGIDVDVISPAIRQLGAMPYDLAEAKGRLLDAEEFVHRQSSRGSVGRSFAGPFSSLLMCLWHIQAPRMWPLRHGPLMERLQREGLIRRGDPAQDLVDYIASVLAMAEATGARHTDLARLLPLLDGELPTEDESISGSIGQGNASLEEGEQDRALRWFDLALAFRPHSAEAMHGRIAAYEGKGLYMMAIAEAEALVEMLPEDLMAHRRLLALYKGRKMIPDHNREVRRFKAIMDARTDGSA